MTHVVEVLTGAASEKIKRWRHEELSTYGIGKDLGRKQWSVIGRELIRMGYLNQVTEKFSVLELTPEGNAVLNERKPVTLSRQVLPPAPLEAQTYEAPRAKAPRAGEIVCDEALFERLRRLRKKLADEKNVPAYIVFSDVSLRLMARDLPATEADFRLISGVGEKKLQEFGTIFLSEIASFPR